MANSNINPTVAVEIVAELKYAQPFGELKDNLRSMLDAYFLTYEPSKEQKVSVYETYTILNNAITQIAKS